MPLSITPRSSEPALSCVSQRSDYPCKLIVMKHPTKQNLDCLERLLTTLKSPATPIFLVGCPPRDFFALSRRWPDVFYNTDAPLPLKSPVTQHLLGFSQTYVIAGGSVLVGTLNQWPC